jgi:DNA polymerase
MNSYKKLLDDTSRLLSFHRSFGVDKYPITKELGAFLAESSENMNASRVQNKHKKSETASRQSTPLKLTGTIAEIRADLGDCIRCSLHKGRTSLIFGSGNEGAKLFIVGEWPNRFDDQAGEIFSGAEGEMLDNMLTHVLKLSRNEVYLSSLIKCRVPEDAHPEAQQISACAPFLLRQIAVVQPKIICAMGPIAAQTLLKTNKSLIKLRGRFHDVHGIPLMPTFHPSYLIKNPELKKAALHDLQMVRQQLAGMP